MRLERHVGGLSMARKVAYLTRRGWKERDGAWLNPLPEADPVPLNKAVHHQLTRDLVQGLSTFGWRVVDYSDRGYARMEDPIRGERCSLPAALRRQARRDGVPVRELTQGLFLSFL